jgi:hypothetical protein
MILPVLPGRPREGFGGAPEDDDFFPPIVDLLAPATGVQERNLQDYDLRRGRPVRLAAVIPARAGARSR